MLADVEREHGYLTAADWGQWADQKHPIGYTAAMNTTHAAPAPAHTAVPTRQHAATCAATGAFRLLGHCGCPVLPTCTRCGATFAPGVERPDVERWRVHAGTAPARY